MFSTHTPPRPYLLLADGHFDGSAILTLAHAEARANVARAAARGVTRSYRAALRNALTMAWADAHSQRWCRERDARLDAMPADHAAILAERTAALMIDSTPRMVAEVAALDARAAAIGVRL